MVGGYIKECSTQSSSVVKQLALTVAAAAAAAAAATFVCVGDG